MLFKTIEIIFKNYFYLFIYFTSVFPSLSWLIQLMNGKGNIGRPYVRSFSSYLLLGNKPPPNLVAYNNMSYYAHGFCGDRNSERQMGLAFLCHTMAGMTRMAGG